MLNVTFVDVFGLSLEDLESFLLLLLLSFDSFRRLVHGLGELGDFGRFQINTLIDTNKMLLKNCIF